MVASWAAAGCGEAGDGPADVAGDADVAVDSSDAAGADSEAPADSANADVAADSVALEDAPPIEGGWTTLAPVLGGAVQENAVVALGSDLYVIGGFQNGFQIVSAVSVYDTVAGAWSAGPPLPAAHHHVVAAVVDDRVLVLGALSGLGFAAARVAWELDGAGAWQELTPLSAERARGAGATAVVGSDVYVVGGFRGGAAVALADRYDAEADTWHEVAALPAARDHLVVASYDGVVYALGGRDTDVDAVRGEVWAFDPEDGVWREREPMPTPRGGAMAGVVGGRIVVVGGEGNPDHPRGVFDDAEAYDPVADSWEVLAPMPTPRHGTGAVGIGDTLYVPGGADKEFFQAVDVFEALTL